jgi:hypothetical protein
MKFGNVFGSLHRIEGINCTYKIGNIVVGKIYMHIILRKMFSIMPMLSEKVRAVLLYSRIDDLSVDVFTSTRKMYFYSSSFMREYDKSSSISNIITYVG